jgi:hypothetical protein
MDEATPTHHSTPSDRQSLVARLQAEAYLSERDLREYSTDVLRAAVEALGSWLDPAMVPLFLSRAQAREAVATPPGPRPQAAQRAPTGDGVPPGGTVATARKADPPGPTFVPLAPPQKPAAKPRRPKSEQEAPPVVEKSAEAPADPATIEVAPRSVPQPPQVHVAPASLLTLSSEETALLADLQRESYDPLARLAKDCDGVFGTGLLIDGPRGMGKTEQVRQALKGRDFHLINSLVTASGLRKDMSKHPTATYLGEDIEDLVGNDRRAASLLRSALWGPKDPKTGRMVRTIRPLKGADEEKAFQFYGAVILTMNCPPKTVLPNIEALTDRVTMLHLKPSREQLLALAHKVALLGYKTTDDHGRKWTLAAAAAAEMWDGYRTILQKGVLPSLRFLEKCYMGRLGAMSRGEPDDWRTYMEMLLAQQNTDKPPLPPVSRVSKAANHRQLARELYAARVKDEISEKEMLGRWAEHTGTGKRNFYNHLGSDKGRED